MLPHAEFLKANCLKFHFLHAFRFDLMFEKLHVANNEIPAYFTDAF